MDKFVAFAFLFSIIEITTSQRIFPQGYYWRDYEGITPTDALPGGLDVNGRPIYIGQVLFGDKLIPGKIYANDSKIYFEWAGKEESVTSNIKILASAAPEQLEWVSTTPDGIAGLTNKLPVKGGYEPNFSTYIGRIFASRETSVGKIICGETNCLALFTTMDGKTAQHTNRFEILTYNPNVRVTTNCSPDIDIRYE